MTPSSQPRMATVTQEERSHSEPPVTGVQAIDEALAAVDLTGAVTAHHEVLGRALDALQRALNTPRPDPQQR